MCGQTLIRRSVDRASRWGGSVDSAGMRRTPAVLVLVLALLAALASAGERGAAPATEGPLEPPAAALESIDAAEAKRHVGFLAGGKCEGRASGLEGCDIAGNYLIDRLREYGCEPAGDDGTFKQVFQVKVTPFPGQAQTTDDVKGQMADTFNVIGVVRGSDEKLRDEYVVLSAHYDHIGRKSKRKTYFGGDDNASGTSALLEAAQAFMLPGAPRPRRSILVLFVSAEERGLLGSAHFVKQPTVPIGQITCDLNTDMVGRNKPKEIQVYGNGTSPDLDSAHLEAAKRSGLTPVPKVGSIFLRSDQYNFYKADIPCLFWTSGLHEDYHATSDTAAAVDERKVERAAVHLYVTAWIVANRTERPRFQKLDENAAAGPLGAVLDVVPPEDVPAEAKLGAGEGAALVRSVMDGMPAAEAKLQAGDLILEVNDKALPSSDPVGAVEDVFEKAKGKVMLRILRGTKGLRVIVKL